MPNGKRHSQKHFGGGYQLIDTITLEENATLTLTQEPDGTPYAFKSVIIKCEFANGLDSGNYVVYAKSDGVRAGSMAPWFAATDEYRYLTYFFMNVDGAMIQLWTQLDVPSGVGAALYYGKTSSPILEVAQTIDGIDILKELRAGTTVRIYAVREE